MVDFLESQTFLRLILEGIRYRFPRSIPFFRAIDLMFFNDGGLFFTSRPPEKYVYFVTPV
jgi:hypothetical protein